MPRFPGGPRRPRPFPKRPVRWIDGNSSPNGDECTYDPSSVLCTPGVGRELIQGSTDLASFDKDEVTVERVVGHLGTQGISVGVIPTGGSIGQFSLPAVRFGILVQEETAAVGGAVAIDLWNQTSVEEYEWMWLHEYVPDGQWDPFNPTGLPADQPATYRWAENTYIDIHVRRKMGRRDHLLLFRQWAVPSTALVFNIAVDLVMQVRVLMKA